MKTSSKIATEKILVGISAGAIGMTDTIAIVNEFTPEMNLWGVSDFNGICLTNLQIMPHYDKMLKRYPQLEERCRKYENDNDCSLVRLTDGEVIIIEQDGAILCK